MSTEHHLPHEIHRVMAQTYHRITNATKANEFRFTNHLELKVRTYPQLSLIITGAKQYSKQLIHTKDTNLNRSRQINIDRAENNSLMAKTNGHKYKYQVIFKMVFTIEKRRKS